MPELEDLRSFLDAPTLKLPIGGKVYTVKPVTAEVWLRLQTSVEKAASGDMKAVIPDRELFRLCLGEDVLKSMSRNVMPHELQRAGTTAYLWQLGREEDATQFWASGGKAPAPNRAARRRTATPTRTGAATTTRQRASRSGTSTRRKS